MTQNLVSQCWDETSQQRQQFKMLGWLDSPLVQQLYVLPTISQGKHGNWVATFMHDLNIPTDGHWLSLGCGSGEQEIYCVEHGFCSRMDAYDISPQSIELAQQRAQEKGFKNAFFHVGGFEAGLGKNFRYDVILMGMSLHHVSSLNKLLVNTNKTLKHDGYFLVNEYIGPSQFQYSRKTLDIVAELLATFPDRLRYDYVQDQIKTTYLRQPRSFWFQVDPSEAICSDLIEGALAIYFFASSNNRQISGLVVAILVLPKMGTYGDSLGAATETRNLIMSCCQR